MPLFATYDWSLLWDERSLLFHALLTALSCAFVALILSTVIGLFLALGRMRKPPVSWLAAFYVNFFRGLPALVTVLWVYFGVSLVVGINFSVFQAGVIALTLLYSAFLAEVYRSALLSIPRGQREAGLALGMRPSRVFLRVVLPQATKVAIPNIGSMFIGMVKDTSTFTLIGMMEIVHVTQDLEATAFQPFVLYTGAAGVYVFTAFALDFIFRRIEKALTTPPSGWLSRLLRRRRTARVELVVQRIEAVSGRT